MLISKDANGVGGYYGQQYSRHCLLRLSYCVLAIKSNKYIFNAGKLEVSRQPSKLCRVEFDFPYPLQKQTLCGRMVMREPLKLNEVGSNPTKATKNHIKEES